MQIRNRQIKMRWGKGKEEESKEDERKQCGGWFPSYHSAQFNLSIRRRTVASDYWSV
jgi:hypothetical protein